jgi:hypothetical protein
VVERPIIRKVSANLSVRQDVEKRRLRELNRESLLQGIVEYRIAGGIREVGKHDGVFVCQSGRWAM